MTTDILDEDKVVVVGNPAWHELGKVFDHPVGAVEAHTEMGGSFTLQKKPAFYQEDDGTFVRVVDNFAIVRGATNKTAKEIAFGFATNHYHVVQPLDIISAFDSKVGVSIETMGFIQDGRKLFLTWKLPSFEVVAGDEIQLYGIVMVGFDTIFSTRLNIGTVRVVCSNTFAAALEEENIEKKKNRGRGTIYSSKHTNSHLATDLGEWMGCIHKNAEKQTALLRSMFGKFAETPILHEKQAEHIILDAYPNPAPIPAVFPEALRRKKEDSIEMETARLEGIRTGIYDVFTGAQGIAIDATYWGLFNAGTQYFNHVMPSKKDTAYSMVWGNRNTHMNHFAEVLKKDIENKG
jgi:phage/plasmid-like protein (TIGR03299 family)